VKILLIGYYLKGNDGDEWLYRKTKLLLTTHYSDVRISLSKFSIFNVDMVVFGGGGLLQNSTSTRSLLYYLFWAFFANFLHKKVLWVGQGIGPVKGLLSRFITRKVLSLAHIISVRDAASKLFCTRINVPIVESVDLSFYRSKIVSGSHSEGLYLNVRGGVSDLSPGVLDYLRSVSDGFIGSTIEDLSLSGDLVSYRLKELLSKSDDINPSGIVSMRFHICAWAALHSVPFLAVVYDEKVKHLAKKLGQAYIDVRQGVSEEDMRQAIEEFLEKKDEYRHKIRLNIESLVKSANAHETVFGSRYLL
jgi:polysaccharide pyruvyl transferase WcaK-like protein